LSKLHAEYNRDDKLTGLLRRRRRVLDTSSTYVRGEENLGVRHYVITSLRHVSRVTWCLLCSRLHFSGFVIAWSRVMILTRQTSTVDGWTA